MRSTVHACSCAPSDQFRYGKCLFFRSKPQTARRQLTASKRSLTTYSQFNLFNDAISKTAFKPKEQKQIGPLKVSPMGLGTWAWGNQLLWGYDKSMDPELQQLFNLVVSKGINIFDTADSYGTGLLNGRSEELLGQFVREFPGSDKQRNSICIATKLAPYPWRITSGQFVAACKGSLRRLGMEQIGIGQLHWSTANYQPLQERALWDGLVALHDQGLVQAVGISNYGPKQMERIHKYLEKRGVPLAAAQVQYSLLSRGPQQEETRAVCRDLGVQMIAYSPLALGMLSGDTLHLRCCLALMCCWIALSCCVLQMVTVGVPVYTRKLVYCCQQGWGPQLLLVLMLLHC
ncbi:hypothetical protein ABBQ38_002472 [Trebouxia sp. C0009 RCD-2024]